MLYNYCKKLKILFIKFVVLRLNITKGLNIYQYLTISSSLATKLKIYSIKIRSPHSQKIKKYNKIDSIKIMMESSSNNKYIEYYYSLNEYINNDAAYKLGFDLYNSIWNDYDPLDNTIKHQYIDSFKSSIGYHELIRSKAIEISSNTILSKNNIIIDEIHVAGRFGVPFITYKGTPKNISPKGIVIAIHGRSTNPDYVFGINNSKSYCREFGNYWLNEGYIVYAPQVDWSAGLSLLKLNYSQVGTDIAKLIDLITYIKKTYNNLPIISCGISHGAILAEIIGVISNNVDAVVSIAGTARGDLFDRFKAGVFKDGGFEFDTNSSFSVNYHFLYNGLGILRLLAPKPLVLSVGTHDWGEDKFELIFKAIDYYKNIGSEENIDINLFYGFHETDPSGEIAALEKVLNLNG
jgi:hypothetical protein